MNEMQVGIPGIRLIKPVVVRINAAGCHECVSHRGDRGGYPIMMVNRKRRLLSRLVVERDRGPIPTGLVVRHRCDNRLCIRPDHLELGTVADNNRDCKERQRNNYGSRNGQAKLSEDQVVVIKQTDGVWNELLGQRFGVSRDTIANIKHGRAWAHVQVDTPAPATTKARPGASNGNAILRPQDIPIIRAAPGYVRGDVFRRFGISRSHFYRIKRGEAWNIVCAGTGLRAEPTETPAAAMSEAALKELFA